MWEYLGERMYKGWWKGQDQAWGGVEVADLWVLSHGSLGRLCLLSINGQFGEMDVSIPVPGLWQEFKGTID